ncbi:hypothetical protein ACHQM5_003062 [Ranunculus cassubicifolius]
MNNNLLLDSEESSPSSTSSSSSTTTELFQDSLDHCLSSASSAAVSEDDYENNRFSPNYNSDNPPTIPIPKFPLSGSNFDVWINGPLSVQERRKRLLKEMGLSNDPLLSRQDENDSEFEFSRSLVSDHRQELGYDSFVFRSKSDGSTRISEDQSESSIHSVDDSESRSVSNCSNHVRSNSRGSRRRKSSGSSIDNSPIGGILRKMDKIGPFSRNLTPNSSTDSLVVRGDREDECAVNSDCGNDDDPNLFCKIKNLDNGQEFVVNELTADGMWNKVKDIDTSRQFTMEEFESCVGHSPIVQELMRRENVERLEAKGEEVEVNENGSSAGSNSGGKTKKKVSWFKSIKNVASAVTGHWERRNSDEWDTSSDKVGRRSSSGTEDSQHFYPNNPEKVRVRQYGKSWKELTALYKNQEIQAHNGSIWCMKFSLDGQYLATAGEDCVIHIWQVTEMEKRGDLILDKLDDGNLNPIFMINGSPDNHLEKKRRSKVSLSRKSANLDHLVVPDSIFALSEKPVCSFQGHLVDVLDLSWSKSEYLLSSSMDKTVRLWRMGSNACLKTFSHSDYVTCIQFNPIDDRYFISGSLDAKVRIWSVPDRKVIDWKDVHEMVTAASYSPDGQSALVGSYKGTCRVFNTSENKLQPESQINLQNKRKKSHLKKITGFQYSPINSSEVLITSADSRIRVVDGTELVQRLKGFRNTNSQMSASLTANGKHVVCASEDSHVYVWKHESSSRPTRTKGVTITNSHEHFHCEDVSVAIPWPVVGNNDSSCPWPIVEKNHASPTTVEEARADKNRVVASVNDSYFFDRFSVTWPEEKLPVTTKNQLPRRSYENNSQERSALGMVIVAATLKGELKIFQNFGLPIRV